MKQVIYVDVLIALNTVVTFIMLLTTAAVAGVKNNVGRLLVGAVTGGLFSLVLLAPDMSMMCVLLTKTAMAVSLVCISFRIRDLRRFAVCMVLFVGTNLFYAGVMYGIDCIFSPRFISTKNGFTYFNIGAAGIIVLCCAVYVIVRFIRAYVIPDSRKPHVYNIEITVGGRSVYTKALLDTGNTVKDFCGGDVIIVGAAVANKLTRCPPETFDAFDPDCLNFLRERGFSVRLLPVDVLGGQKMLVAFTADKAVIEADAGDGVILKPCIAVAGESFDTLEYDALLAQSAIC